MTKVYPFGKPEETRNQDNSVDTPQQKKFERATGKDSDGATGPVDKKQAQNPTESPQATGELKTDLKTPAGLDAGAWAEAEKSWRNMGGGHDIAGAEDAIRAHYDQIVANNEQTQKWEGK